MNTFSELTDKGTRAFIAYMLPLDTAALLQKKVRRLDLSEDSPIRWTPPQNYHLTLRFLGDSSIEQLKQVSEELKTQLDDFPSFLSMSGGIEYYPNDNRPRIMALKLHSGRRMDDLHRVCEGIARRAGFSPDTRYFRPHVTLARSLEMPLSELPWQIPGYRIKVEELALVASDLRSDGARYRVLETFPLR